MTGGIRHLGVLAGDGAITVVWWDDGDATIAGDATLEQAQLVGVLRYLADAVETGLAARLPVPPGLHVESIWDDGPNPVRGDGERPERFPPDRATGGPSAT